MTVFTRDACGFNNGTAKLSYTFDDVSSPPTIVEIRLTNSGPGFTFNVELLSRVDRSHVATFSQPESSGADQIMNRAAIVSAFGDLRMVDVVGKNASHGWDLPYFVRCWSS